METNQENNTESLERLKYLEKRRKNYLETKEKRKIYLEKNKEYILSVRKIYKEKNKGKIQQKNRLYRKINEEKIREYNSKFYKLHKNDPVKWSELNKEKVQLYKRKYQENIKPIRGVLRKEKLLKNPSLKLEGIFRGRIRSALKAQGAKKFTKSMDVLGCTPEFARNYISSKFKPDMSWDNHALKGWHIDHIIPCSSFDLSDPEQQKECFHYTNLQPLWWWENLQKSDKIIPSK